MKSKKTTILSDARLNIWKSLSELTFRYKPEDDILTTYLLFGEGPHRNTNPFLFNEHICYVSIVHGFLHQLAIALDMHLVAAEILRYPNSYTLKKLQKQPGYFFKSSKFWGTCQSHLILHQLITKYYEQNTFFKQQLLRTKGGALVYCREPSNWSCGLYQHQKSKIKYRSNWLGINLFGTILVEVRDGFL